MKRLLLLAATLAAVCLAIDRQAAVRADVRADVRGAKSLTALVAANSLTRDTNGDGLPDSVAARVIVPAAPALVHAGLQMTSSTLAQVLANDAWMPGQARHDTCFELCGNPAARASSISRSRELPASCAARSNSARASA